MSTLRESLAHEAYSLTQRFDSVRYELGKKGNPEGRFTTVDCSGWTSFLANRIFDSANSALGASIFPRGAKSRLNTYSDAQIVALEEAGAELVTSADVLQGPTFSMYLIGVNFGDYAWERNAPRKHGIDHVLLTVLSPDGSLVLSNSSSSGNGVSIAQLSWIQRSTLRGRVFAADLMSLATGETRPMGGVETIDSEEVSDITFTDPSTEGVPAG